MKKFLELYEKKINNFCLLLFFCKVDKKLSKKIIEDQYLAIFGN